MGRRGRGKSGTVGEMQLVGVRSGGVLLWKGKDGDRDEAERRFGGCVVLCGKGGGTKGGNEGGGAEGRKEVAREAGRALGAVDVGGRGSVGCGAQSSWRAAASER